MKHNFFQELLSKEITRKEFLLHIGLLLLIITGISALLKTLSNPHLLTPPATLGFEAGPYGGVKKA
jgi:hypothetical protein